MMFAEQDLHRHYFCREDGRPDTGLEHGLRVVRLGEQGVPVEVQVLTAKGVIGRRQGETEAPLPGA